MHLFFLVKGLRSPFVKAIILVIIVSLLSYGLISGLTTGETHILKTVLLFPLRILFTALLFSPFLILSHLFARFYEEPDGIYYARWFRKKKLTQERIKKVVNLKIAPFGGYSIHLKDERFPLYVNFVEVSETMFNYNYIHQAVVEAFPEGDYDNTNRDY